MTPALWPWRRKSGEDAGAPGAGDPAGTTDHARTDGNEGEPAPRAEDGPALPAPGGAGDAPPPPPQVGAGTSSSVRVEVSGEGAVGAGPWVTRPVRGPKGPVAQVPPGLPVETSRRTDEPGATGAAPPRG